MSIRTFNWADSPELTRFFDSRGTAEGDGRELARRIFQETLAQPGLNPTSNCFLLGQDGGEEGIPGYCLVYWEPAISRVVLEMAVAPALESSRAERNLAQLAASRSAELGAQVAHICLPAGLPRQTLLEAEGFSQVRVYWDMLWNHTPVTPALIPEAYSLRSFRKGDAATLTQLQNAAFTSSWGFAPNTVEQIEHRSARSNTSHSAILLLYHGDRAAGYCLTAIVPDRGKPKGIIGMIGVSPDYRGKGISKPILTASMEYLQSAGVAEIGLEVDGSNTPAIRLYHSVGLEKVGELNWFELNLRAPVRPH